MAIVPRYPPTVINDRLRALYAELEEQSRCPDCGSIGLVSSWPFSRLQQLIVDAMDLAAQGVMPEPHPFARQVE